MNEYKYERDRRKAVSGWVVGRDSNPRAFIVIYGYTNSLNCELSDGPTAPAPTAFVIVLLIDSPSLFI